MQWHDHVIRRIMETQPATEPWPHIHVEAIFPAEFYAELQCNLPALSEMKPLSRMTQKRHMLYLHDKGKAMPAPAFWQEIRDHLPTIVGALEKCYGARGSEITSAVVYDEPGYELVPHTDMARRLMTGLFYLPSGGEHSSQGTEILRGSQPDPQGFNKAFDDRFETVKTIPFVPNSALFFQRSDWSYHAVRKTTAPRWTMFFEVMR